MLLPIPISGPQIRSHAFAYACSLQLLLGKRGPLGVEKRETKKKLPTSMREGVDEGNGLSISHAISSIREGERARKSRRVVRSRVMRVRARLWK